MQTLKVGIRQFREKLATYLLEFDTPVAITRHGFTVGYYLPTRHKSTPTEREAYQAAAASLMGRMNSEGLSENELVTDYMRWRTNIQSKRQTASDHALTSSVDEGAQSILDV